MKQEVKDMQENYRRFTVELHDYTNEELAEFFQQTQNEDYLKELMAKNSGIILTIARSYHIPAYDLEDLLSVGYEALWDATIHFESERGFAFTTFLKNCVMQKYNRLYNGAHREKRNNGADPLSYEGMEDIHKEGSKYDDYSSLYLEDFLNTLKDTARQVAELLMEGFTKSETAKAVGCTPATVNYYLKQIRKAYIAYSQGV